MHYILNQHHQIIAADNDILTLCEAEHLDDLLLQIIQNEIHFTNLSPESTSIKTDTTEHIFSTEKTVLSSMLGEMTLITLSPYATGDKEEESLSSTLEDTHTDETSAKATNLDSIDNKDTIEDMEDTDAIPAFPLLKEDAIESNVADATDEVSEDTTKALDTLSEPSLLKEESVESDTIDISDEGLKDTSEELDNALSELSLLKEEATQSDAIEATDEISEETTEALDDTLSEISLLKEEVAQSDTAENTDEISKETTEVLDDTLSEISLLKEEVDIEDTSEENLEEDITIDIEKISQTIGISTDDYRLFFDEFIDTAFSLEEDLRSTHEENYKNGITTLSYLSDALHLPILQKAIANIDRQEGEMKAASIDTFYRMLSTLSTEGSKTIDAESAKEENTTIELFDDIPLVDSEEAKEEVKEEVTEETKPSHTEGFGSLSLEEVQPIHFNFKLEEAAEDLSLPVELIEEFVQDFIEQAHSETKKMLEAYEAGDLETIQKIGHLLKGASSNLRINTLSETLYNIQFCEDPNNLEALIKDYWGHFLAFEKQINIISNQ